jgi:hypothetical protein
MTFSPRNVAQSSEITHNYEKELKGIEKVEWTPSVLFVMCFFIFTIGQKTSI